MSRYFSVSGFQRQTLPRTDIIEMSVYELHKLVPPRQTVAYTVILIDTAQQMLDNNINAESQHFKKKPIGVWKSLER